MGLLIGFPLFIVLPCVIAIWLGTRARSAAIAFVLTWIATPLVSFVLTVFLEPVLRSLIPAGNDGTGAMMLPYLGIGTGVIAGIIAAVIVQRRRVAAALKPDGKSK